jgi:tripartite-type tricarboxylate transporter receptor subunit TctC
MFRNTVLAATMIAASAFTVSAPAVADGFPEKDITFLIPYKPGGGFDATSRIVIKTMQKYLPNDVNVIPKNLPGAGGKKAYGALYKAKPDGYTIGSINYPGAAVPGITGAKVTYDFDELTWLARMNKDPYVLGANKDSNLHSLEDIKSSEKAVKILQTGSGSTAYAAAAIVTKVVGINARVLTGYTSSKKYILGLIRGDGDLALAPMGSYRKFLQSGDVRPIVTFDTTSTIDGLPTIAEAGYPELTGLGVQRLIAAPPGLPDDVRQILSDAIAKALADPDAVAWSEQTKRDLHPLNAMETEKEVKVGTDFFKEHKDVIGKEKKES